MTSLRGTIAPLVGVFASLIFLAPFTACSDSADLSVPIPAFDGSATFGGHDAAGPNEAGDASVPAATFRVAHLAPDLGTIDVCYRVSTSEAFTGPLLAELSPPRDAGVLVDTANDAGAPDASALLTGVSFRGVTNYFTAPNAASVEIAVVNASDASCSTPRARSRVTLEPGKHVTITLMGLAEADAGAIGELALVPFVDDTTTTPSGARTRIIHAALGATSTSASGPFAVNVIDGSVTTALSSLVLPRKTSAPSGAEPMIDALGYHTSAAIASGSIRLEKLADGGAAAWVSSAKSLGMMVSSLHTALVVSTPTNGLAVVWCDDGAAGLARLGALETPCITLRP
jgi:hypothetical protein